MKIGIIGPMNVRNYCKKIKIKQSKYKQIIKKLAKKIAESGNEIVVTPDKGSCSELTALEYKKAGGKKINVIAPLNDKEFGYSWLNLKIADKIINCKTWRNQPENFCENCELMVSIGWGGGTLTEIYYTRWFGKVKKVWIINELIDKKLPESLNKSCGILEYTSINKLKI